MRDRPLISQAVDQRGHRGSAAHQPQSIDDLCPQVGIARPPKQTQQEILGLRLTQPLQADHRLAGDCRRRTGCLSLQLPHRLSPITTQGQLQRRPVRDTVVSVGDRHDKDPAGRRGRAMMQNLKRRQPYLRPRVIEQSTRRGERTTPGSRQAGGVVAPGCRVARLPKTVRPPASSDIRAKKHRRQPQQDQRDKPDSPRPPPAASRRRQLGKRRMRWLTRHEAEHLVAAMRVGGQRAILPQQRRLRYWMMTDWGWRTEPQQRKAEGDVSFTPSTQIKPGTRQ